MFMLEIKKAYQSKIWTQFFKTGSLDLDQVKNIDFEVFKYYAYYNLVTLLFCHLLL